MPESELLSAADERFEIDPERLAEAFRLYGDITNVGIDLRIERWERQGRTTGQLRLMVLLRDSPNGLALNEIARAMRVSPATITGITDRLVRRGLIEREADPNDRRVIRAVLTEQGRGQLEVFTGPGRAALAETFRRMGPEAFQHWIDSVALFVDTFLQVSDEARDGNAAI